MSIAHRSHLLTNITAKQFRAIVILPVQVVLCKKKKKKNCAKGTAHLKKQKQKLRQNQAISAATITKNYPVNSAHQSSDTSGCFIALPALPLFQLCCCGSNVMLPFMVCRRYYTKGIMTAFDLMRETIR